MLQEAELEEKVAEKGRELVTANEKLKELDKLKDVFQCLPSLRTPLTAMRDSPLICLDGVGPLDDLEQDEPTSEQAQTDWLGSVEDLFDLRSSSGRAEMKPSAYVPAYCKKLPMASRDS